MVGGETGQPGALRVAGGNTATWAGNITLAADAGIYSQAGGSIFNINGSITGNFVCDSPATARPS